MPRGTQLTDIEKGQILAHHSDGRSMRWISRQISRSLRVIQNFLKDPDGYGTHHAGGAKCKLSGRTERAIFRAASNSTVGSRALQREFAPGISHMTVFRYIQRNPHLVRRVMRKRPKLTDDHIRQRREWAETFRFDRAEWRNVSLIFEGNS